MTVAHLCRCSPAKHTDAAKSAPRRLQAYIRGKCLRLASVSAARHWQVHDILDAALRAVAAPWGSAGEQFMPTGGQNAQELQESSQRYCELLRNLRREVWAYPLLLLADGVLLQEVCRPVQSAQRGRPQTAELGASRLDCLANTSRRCTALHWEAPECHRISESRLIAWRDQVIFLGPESAPNHWCADEKRCRAVVLKLQVTDPYCDANVAVQN